MERESEEMSFVNEASWDRIIRVVLGIVMLYLGWAGVVRGSLGVVFQYLGLLPLITGLVGWCPAYALLRFRTKKA
jgi:hypothetical protein